MKTLGTTGTRQVTYEEGVDVLLRHRRYFSEFDRFITGGCRGWDAIAGEWFFRTFPNRIHRVQVPANLTQVDPWWLKSEIVEMISTLPTGILYVDQMPEDTSYKDRNIKIVDMCDELFYCADHPEIHSKSRRSGTWQTVRLARGIRPVYGEILRKSLPASV